MLAKHFASVISARTGTEVNVGRAYFVFFNRVILKDVYIMYSEKDTLMSSQKISATFSAGDLLNSKYNIKSIKFSKGVFNLVNESRKVTNLDRVLGLKNGKSKVKKEKSKSIKFNINHIQISEFRFNFKNSFTGAVDYGPGYINFTNLHVSDININVRNLRYNNDTLTARIDNLTARDESGFTIREFCGDASISPTESRISNLKIYDGHTRMDADHFSFLYSKAKDFAEFTNKVKMELFLHDSYFSFRTIAKITPALDKNFLGFHIRGNVSGTVNAITAENLEAITESGLSAMKLNARISGLPKTKLTVAFVDINQCKTNTYDILDIVSKLNSSNTDKFKSQLAPGINYSFTGELAGLLTDFVASGKIVSDIGNLNLDVLLKSEKSSGGFGMDGRIISDNFDIGRLLMNNNLGKVTLNSSLRAVFRSKSRGGSKFVIDTLSIKRFDYNNYSYSGIQAGGKLENNIFDGRVICHDPNLDLMFQGIIGLPGKYESHYDFYANIIYADLAALRLDKRDTVSKISVKTLANYTRKPSGDIFGSIDVTNLKYTNSHGTNDIGDIRFKSLSKTDEFWATLKSDFADAEYRGKGLFASFISQIKYLTIGRHTPVLLKEHLPDTANSNKGKYNLSVKFKNTQAAAELFMPGFLISANSEISLNIVQDILTFKASSPFIKYKTISLTDMETTGTFTADKGDILLNTGSTGISGINFDNSSISVSAFNNCAAVSLSYTNKDKFRSSLNLKSSVKFEKSPQDALMTNIGLKESSFTVNSVPWKFSEARIIAGKRDFRFENFKISHDNQYLTADGAISENPDDKLTVNIKDLDFDPVNILFGDKVNLKGRLSGNAEISKWYNEPSASMDLKCYNLVLNGTEAGDISIESKWDPFKRLFDIQADNIYKGDELLNISGTYNPENSQINLETRLNGLRLKIAEPFLKDLADNMEGKVFADATITGSPGKLVINCDKGKITEASLRVIYTNVKYNLESDFSSDEKGFRFYNGKISDRNGNGGKLNFSMNHKNFRNFNMSGGIEFSNMESINTKESDNPSFYGNVFGTGNLNINGTFKKIALNIYLKSDANSLLHIPISSASEAAQTDLLTFVQPKSSTSEKGSRENNLTNNEAKKGASLDLKLKVAATPEAALKIEINKAVGDVITGYGNGIIDIDVKTAEKTFDIYGDYIIDNGNYQFGYALKQFEINKGGRISFNGNILNANLDLTASYKTKASINALISDTTSVGNRRTVDCQISMNGPLTNPGLGFSIDIPDLDPASAARVSAALNSEDKVLRQVMSILISGSFVPDMQSNIVNNTNIIYSNLSEIFSNQINSIFNQLQIPVDLNFNYQQGNSGKNIFDAAVSARLLDNRILVNGNIGNSPYANSGTLTGDLEVEVKLDQKGKIRARIFSRSADKFSNYLEGIQRNGFGVVYQDEFDSFSELFDKIFLKNKKVKVPLSQSAQ
jgi:hypothetical protein